MREVIREVMRGLFGEADLASFGRGLTRGRRDHALPRQFLAQTPVESHARRPLPHEKLCAKLCAAYARPKFWSISGARFVLTFGSQRPGPKEIE